ncbi:MAG: hypothetical protein EHM84_02005 [Lysobacterales bacterium]|nr:MAG: hypothetical protein EHM84_02005 [Xanthomonadales bacterium]
MENRMKTLIKGLVLGALGLTASAAQAWVFSDGVIVDQVWQWENEASVVVVLSNGVACHLSPTEKQLYALVLSLSVAEKSANVVCHDAVDSVNGVSARKLHRVIAL